MTRRTAGRGARLALATLVLYLVLVQPHHPGATTWGALLVFPLELPAILALLMLLPERGGATLLARILLVAWLSSGAILKLADLATFVAFDRPFSLVFDLPLAEAGLRLAAGSFGTAPAIFAVLGAVASVAALTAALWWSTGVWARLRLSAAGRAGAALLGVAALGLAAVDMRQSLPGREGRVDPPGAAFTARLTLERVASVQAALADLERFEQEAASDPYAGRAGLLDRLAGRDVLIVFVESYGRASFDNPLYAPTHRRTLAEAEARLAASGLAMRSGWLASPIFGGQSWLAHGTLASGLRLDHHGLYGAMLASERRTLFHVAGEAGFRTLAVMPAITLAWPEGDRLGFSDIRDAKALNYRGQPFDWVTMPDQFTLAALDAILENDGGRPPVFAQVALISSHAPWVPIPEIVPWEEVGDGTVFDRFAASGDSPEDVWADPDRVREQYRLALDYSLRIVTDHAARPRADPPLTVVVGDHQPARFVSGSDSRDVPIHLIGPPDLVAWIDAWNWRHGLQPGPDAPAWPMEAFRDRFLDAFTTGPAPP